MLNVDVLLTPSAQFDFFQLFHEADKTRCLLAQAVEDLGIFEPAVSVEKAIDSRHKNAFGINVTVPIREDAGELLDGPESAPHAVRESGETHWPPFEAFRELQHVDEIFQHTGKASVVF